MSYFYSVLDIICIYTIIYSLSRTAGNPNPESPISHRPASTVWLNSLPFVSINPTFRIFLASRDHAIVLSFYNLLRRLGPSQLVVTDSKFPCIWDQILLVHRRVPEVECCSSSLCSLHCPLGYAPLNSLSIDDLWFEQD